MPVVATVRGDSVPDQEPFSLGELPLVHSTSPATAIPLKSTRRADQSDENTSSA